MLLVDKKDRCQQWKTIVISTPSLSKFTSLVPRVVLAVLVVEVREGIIIQVHARQQTTFITDLRLVLALPQLIENQAMHLIEEQHESSLLIVLMNLAWIHHPESNGIIAQVVVNENEGTQMQILHYLVSTWKIRMMKSFVGSRRR